jgi:hypothetical protein
LPINHTAWWICQDIMTLFFPKWLSRAWLARWWEAWTH